MSECGYIKKTSATNKRAELKSLQVLRSLISWCNYTPFVWLCQMFKNHHFERSIEATVRVFVTRQSIPTNLRDRWYLLSKIH